MSADSLSSWISAVKARLAAATPGPWEAPNSYKRPLIMSGSTAVISHDCGTLGVESPGWPVTDSDAALIASAPSDLALAVRLIEAVENAVCDTALMENRYSDKPDDICGVRAALHSAFEAEKS